MNNLKYLIPTSLGLILALVLIKTHLINQSKTSEDISKRLTTIQAELINLQQEAKKPYEAVDLTAINQDFNKLVGLMEQLKGKETHKDNQPELIEKLDALQEMVKGLDKKKHPIKYLSVTALPFKVISIDSIQQVSVATIAYDYKTLPLEQGDTLASWSVLSLDFGKQTMEVENSNKERVLIKLGEANV